MFPTAVRGTSVQEHDNPVKHYTYKDESGKDCNRKHLSTKTTQAASSDRERTLMLDYSSSNPGFKHRDEGTKETLGIITQFFSNVYRVETKALERQ